MAKAKFQVIACMVVICIVLVGALTAVPRPAAAASSDEIQLASDRAAVAAAAVQRFYDPATGRLMLAQAPPLSWFQAHTLGGVYSTRSAMFDTPVVP